MIEEESFIFICFFCFVYFNQDYKLFVIVISNCKTILAD